MSAVEQYLDLKMKLDLTAEEKAVFNGYYYEKNGTSKFSEDELKEAKTERYRKAYWDSKNGIACKGSILMSNVRELFASGFKNKEIAEKLACNRKTVEVYVSRIKKAG